MTNEETFITYAFNQFQTALRMKRTSLAVVLLVAIAMRMTEAELLARAFRESRCILVVTEVNDRLLSLLSK